MIRDIRNVIFLSIGLTLTMNAQKEELKTDKIIVADTTQVTYESKLRPALSYKVDVDAKNLKKHWKDFLKKRHKTSYKIEEKTFLVTKDIVVNTISDKRINLLAEVIEQESNSIINFSGAFGYDIYIDDKIYPNEFKGLKLFAETFLLESSTLFYADQIADLSEEISKLNNKNSSLAKDNVKDNGLIKAGDDELAILNKTKNGETADSVKILKKISKITKKQVSYKSDIIKNNLETEANQIKINALKKQIEARIARQKLLKK